MGPDRRKIILALGALLLCLSMVPPVSGDGMPLYTYYEQGGEEQDLYSTTFESRQLANVVLLNGTHQRIDLFLSIFSLDPVHNLTVLVPFRELPVEVNMEETTDSEFLREANFDKIKKAGRKQDLSLSSSRLADRYGNVLWDMSASTVSTPLGPLMTYIVGEYSEEDWNYYDEYGDVDKEGGSGGEDYDRTVKEVAHYDFEGTSLSIYSVNANATLQDFIEVVDLGTIPMVTREVVEEYRDQYVAVIESEPSPPIDEETYRWMQDLIPSTLEDIISGIMADPTVTYSQAQELTVSYSMQGFREIIDTGADLSDWMDQIGEDDQLYIQSEIDMWLNDEYAWRSLYMDYEQPFRLRDKMEKLLFAIYGFTDFTGHTLSVVTELNDGKVYFPLGTSKGWDNPIAETVVICRTDKDTSLSLNLDPHREAFIGDHHYYLFDIPHDNPTEDVEGRIKDTTFGQRFEVGLSDLIFDSSPYLALIMGIISQLILWTVCLLISRDPNKGKLHPISGRTMLLGVLNVAISAPLTYLLFVSRPFSDDEKGDKGLRNSYIVFFLVQIAFVIAGVVF